MREKSMKRKCLAVGIILLFVGTSIIPVTAQDIEKSSLPTSRSNWLYVGGDGPGNYTKIQDAIDNASDGDIVFVFNGTYYENINIDKIISLIGENKNNTIIDGTNGNESVITIIANSICIWGFTISNSGEYGHGIFLRPNFNGVSIVDNIFKNNNVAISLQGSHNTYVSGNLLIDNYHDAIGLINSSNNTIYRNVVINTTGASIALGGNSNNNNVHSNTINHSSMGIIVTFSSNHNTISKNNIKNCEYGIDLSGAFNEVSSNMLSDNELGVFLVWYADYNTINNNTILNNINGVRTETHNSSNNTFYHNNFLNNTIHAYVNDECINKWDNGYPSCGNYWDDYTGDDAFWGQNQKMNGADGVGDIPRHISSGENQDRYPLMEPYAMTQLTFNISGGFGIKGKIRNVGNTAAFRVCWGITFTGGFILFGRDTLCVIPKPLLPGEEFTVRSNMIVGFGKTTMTMTFWADNAPYVSKSTPGTLFLFFIKI